MIVELPVSIRRKFATPLSWGGSPDMGMDKRVIQASPSPQLRQVTRLPHTRPCRLQKCLPTLVRWPVAGFPGRCSPDATLAPPPMAPFQLDKLLLVSF